MTDGSQSWARQQIIDTALAMSASGLSPGRSGNVSCRWGEGILITPTGMAYDDLLPGDIVYVGPDGEMEEGARKPSSEWRFHQSAYGLRREIQAMVHTHSRAATVLACAHRSVPAFHYMIAVAGGKEIPLIPYATFGTQDLADHVARGLAAYKACLMANHGQIAVGSSLEDALELANEVETLCSQYVALLAIGEVHLIDDAEMDEVLKHFRSYGQQSD